MNKPAAKEPSMDEILSSIRQIIADEDQDTGVAEAPQSISDEAVSPDSDQDAPLALSPEQMISTPDSIQEPSVEEPQSPETDLSLPDDIAFEDTDTSTQGFQADEEVAELANMVTDAQADIEEDEVEPEIVLADDIGFDDEGEAHEPEPAMAEAAPMPDPDLSGDIAEKLLEPTTTAATKHAFNRLNQLAVGSGELTIENMVRDMLRPMLKDWLDENLPAVVEKLVEREIERVSRGS